MIKKITIKFGMELKPTQVSWKSQLYKRQFLIQGRRSSKGGM